MPLQPMAKQLVHVPKPTVAKRPKRAEFISEWDNTVSQQTRGKQTSTKSQQHKAASKRKQQQRDAQRLPQQQKGPQISSSDNSRLQQILFPSQQQLQQQMQLDFADDLSHLPTGDTTQLDTFSWRYATFFNRVKESVAQAWHPARQLRRYNPDGAGLKDSRATTQLLITINRTGELVKVVLLRSSGFDYLDQAAQMAFWRAQPFLKPPAALFGEQQQVSFRFSFVVSMRPVHTG
ncbi:MAG: TonB family protein [Myxococcota bacterium]